MWRRTTYRGCLLLDLLWDKMYVAIGICDLYASRRFRSNIGEHAVVLRAAAHNPRPRGLHRHANVMLR